jgi:exodeoxyribonuclease VII large subunit
VAEASLPLPQRTLRVSELTRYLKYVIEQDDLLTSLSIRGEISDLSRSASGHLYFTLKDDASQVSCVLFRREALQQTSEVQQLRKGIAVVVHGFLTVYEPRGSYQIYVERVLVQGEGAAFRRVELLREQLEREGLFSAERKRALPPFPRKLALITSPESQAYHDVLHRLRVQYPFVTVIVAGASVQGDGAADELVMALDIVNRLTDAEVVLLVRGGGAPEELAAFNEERLARAIFASRVPVVTGIGHQTDNSIADYVADFRAATPSLAAAAAVPDIAGLVRSAARLHAEMSGIMRQRLARERQRIHHANRALLHARPETKLRNQRQRNDEMRRATHRAVVGHLTAKRARLAALKVHLGALDPLAILARGYAVLTDPETGRVVSRVERVEPGEPLRARVSDGEFDVRVEETWRKT